MGFEAVVLTSILAIERREEVVRYVGIQDLRRADPSRASSKMSSTMTGCGDIARQNSTGPPKCVTRYRALPNVPFVDVYIEGKVENIRANPKWLCKVGIM